MAVVIANPFRESACHGTGHGGSFPHCVGVHVQSNMLTCMTE